MCQKGHESRINAVEIRSLQNLRGVTLADRVRNIELRERLVLTESVGVKIEKGMFVS